MLLIPFHPHLNPPLPMGRKPFEEIFLTFFFLSQLKIIKVRG
jgi:hypothetical protein